MAITMGRVASYEEYGDTTLWRDFPKTNQDIENEKSASVFKLFTTYICLLWHLQRKFSMSL